MRKHSHYGLDFYTIVLILSNKQGLSIDEIKAELDKQVRSFQYSGPHIETISRWLALFRRDAEDYASFFVQKLKEHNLTIPAKLPLEAQARKPDYRSWYFLECICNLHFQLHPKSKHKFQFLWHAESLLRSHFKRGLFTIRPP
ncbi:MAG: hypothetical protein KKF93_06360 [Candidatus Omnitrophica bacterium]|nr:hypothetical protein [Candidatus Omnitrophota bacterium]